MTAPADQTLWASAADLDAALGDHKGVCACGESRAAAMTLSGLCYACDLARRDLAASEEHHLFGRSSAITFRLGANDHRVLDALRCRRPEPLRKMGGGTLQAVAVVLATLGDALAVFFSGAPAGLTEMLVVIARCGALALINIDAHKEIAPWRP